MPDSLVIRILSEIDSGIMGNPNMTNYDKEKFLSIIGKMDNEEFQIFCNLLNFKKMKTLSDKIVNELNEKFNLNLKTVDSFAMSETVEDILKSS